MRTSFKTLAAAVVATALSATAAQATMISANMTVDNYFSAYLSTNNATLGTLIGSGTNWPSLQSFSGALTGGMTNYLHVVAGDTGPPSMFIGAFTLSDAAFKFSNGTQSLLTNPINWTASLVPFGPGTPFDGGMNGTSPWGTFALDANARYLWLDSMNSGGVVYFSTAISAVNAGQNVPEPMSLALFALGLMGLGAFYRRRLTQI